MTFMPRDADLARQMVGNLFVRGVPDKLSAEYKIRVRMVNAAGVTDGLGPVGMMMLLRDFRLDKVEAAAPKKVSAWRGINPGTEVTHLGRAAVFKQATSDNAVLIQYHGHRAATEVPGEEVSLADEIVEGVPNEAFEQDRSDDLGPAAAAKGEALADEPTKAELLYQEWGNVNPTSEVMVTIDGKEVAAEFIDVEGEALTVLLNGSEMRVDPASVKLPVPA